MLAGLASPAVQPPSPKHYALWRGASPPHRHPGDLNPRASGDRAAEASIRLGGVKEHCPGYIRIMSEMGESGYREPSAAELVTRLSEQISRLIRDELQLALTELKQKVKRAGIGGGLIGAAGAVALLGLGALMVTTIVALARLLPLWAAALIVGGATLLLAGLLALLGIDQLKSVIPPIPEQAIASMKRSAPG